MIEPFAGSEPWNAGPDLSASTNATSADSETLFATRYAELHRLARRELSRHLAAISMGPTTLLHGAYINIAERRDVEFPDPSRFIGYVCRVMRGLLIDHLRKRLANKRGGMVAVTSLTEETEAAQTSDRDILMVAEALDELAKADPSLADIVHLKFFCGFSFAEIGAIKNQSERTIQRGWERARVYLYESMRPEVMA